jgi:hypothetical protein
MLSDLASLVLTMTPVFALLVWQERADRRQRAAWIVRADIDAGARRALEGESLLAVDVRCPTLWSAGEVRLTTPRGYESLIAQASRSIFERVPNGYDVIIHCGGGA